MTDTGAAAAQTVRDRLLAAGLSAERIAEHLQAGRIVLDGEPVADLEQLAPGRLVIRKT